MVAQEAQCAVVVGSSTYPSQNGPAFRWRKHLIHRKGVPPGKYRKNRRPHPRANPQGGLNHSVDAVDEQVFGDFCRTQGLFIMAKCRWDENMED